MITRNNVTSAVPDHLKGLPPVKYYRSDFMGRHAQELLDCKIHESLVSPYWDVADEARAEAFNRRVDELERQKKYTPPEVRFAGAAEEQRKLYFNFSAATPRNDRLKSSLDKLVDKLTDAILAALNANKHTPVKSQKEANTHVRFTIE